MTWFVAEECLSEQGLLRMLEGKRVIAAHLAPARGKKNSPSGRRRRLSRASRATTSSSAPVTRTNRTVEWNMRKKRMPNNEYRHIQSDREELILPLTFPVPRLPRSAGFAVVRQAALALLFSSASSWPLPRRDRCHRPAEPLEREPSAPEASCKSPLPSYLSQ